VVRSTGAGLALLIAIAALAPSMPSVAAGPTAPNVLIIVTDDQRVNTFEVMPQTRRLFGELGINFTNAFATTPLCCQSRASIMTGRYAHNHGIRYFTPYELDQSTTVQAYLSENGYRTGIYGKYLNNWKIVDPPPFFDDWAVFPQSTGETYVGGTWNVNGTVQPVTQYSTDFILENAKRFVRETEAEDVSPWYMYLAPPAPHAPFVAEEQYVSAPVPAWEGNPAVSEKNLSDKPPYVRTFDRKCDLECGTAIREGQLRTLMSVDDMVGELFAELDDLLETPNTLAIFISDNGIFWGEHGLVDKKPPYLPDVRIPLFLRWPLRLLPGEDDRIAANLDIAPTILEAAGITPDNAPIDGQSLLVTSDRRRLLLENWRARGVPTWSSLVSNNYQYIESYERWAFLEYYNLANDPYQLVNLMRDGNAATGPGVTKLRRLRRALEAAEQCAGVTCP